MTHDPLCPGSKGCKCCGECMCEERVFCWCDLIWDAREDERRQAVERVRAEKGKFPSTRLDWDTIVIAILDGTKLRLSKKELNARDNANSIQ